MRAQKCKVTVSTYEVEGDDLSLKTRSKRELLEGTERGLSDSTIDIEAIRHNNWFEAAKKKARTNALKGVVYAESMEYWVAAEEKEEDEIDVIDKDDKDLKLSELRERYPDVKATSVAAFLEKVAELPQVNGNKE